jgi:hypothetical protein
MQATTSVSSFTTKNSGLLSRRLQGTSFSFFYKKIERAFINVQRGDREKIVLARNIQKAVRCFRFIAQVKRCAQGTSSTVKFCQRKYSAGISTLINRKQ